MPAVSEQAAFDHTTPRRLAPAKLCENLCEKLDSKSAKIGFVYPGQTHALSGGERVQYQLRAYGTVSEQRPDVATSYSLWLSGQPLARFSIVELEAPRLLWAGDLDRDVRLDLFFDLQAGSIGDSYTLFLSSLASLGSFVAKAAELKVSGC